MSGYEMDQGPLPGSQPPGMPMEAGYDDFGGGMGGAPEAGQDMGMSGMSGMSAQSPMMPPEGSLTPETLMGNVAMMGPGDRQTLQMAMADPNLEGALLSLLGAGFAPVLMSLSPQGSPGGMMPGGGAPMGGDPSMGGGLPSAAQGQPMGGYAGGGMVQPHRGASPPGVRPPGLPPTRQPMPFQARPAHGLSSMQPGTAFR